MVHPTASQRTVVKTTIPSLPYPLAPSISTGRLLLRQYTRDDIPAIYALRSQPEVMLWSPKGLPDTDTGTSVKIVESNLSAEGEKNLNYVICLPDGEVIGTCGVRRRDGLLGWPVIGYMLRKEAWGKGYATEAAKAIMEAWWAFPREEAEIEVDAGTLEEGAQDNTEHARVAECVVAITVEENAASRSVLTKGGFQLGKILVEPDMRDPTRNVELYCYVARKP